MPAAIVDKVFKFLKLKNKNGTKYLVPSQSECEAHPGISPSVHFPKFMHVTSCAEYAPYLLSSQKEI